VQGQILLAAPGSSWDQDPLEDPDPLLGPAPRGKSPPNGSAQPQKTRKDPDLPEDPAARAEALAQRANDAKRKLNDLRKDLEITRRLEQMSVSMHLQYEERAAMEEIVRNHVRNVDDVASRARELLKDSPFGIAPTDRAALDQMEQDRRKVDDDTEQAILSLVGPDRWKEFRKSVKDQNDKERALRRLGQPW
ncbi:MAG: hypothetical protein L6R43_16440, partial [Planctomycetes bacterium]|nr:hypothetical protein [Planctomycetota bacterium]